MRNPNRIRPFCDELAALWQSYVPDWRFGQLISNVFGEIIAQTKRDIWFMEEDEIMEEIRKYFEGDSENGREESELHG